MGDLPTAHSHQGKVRGDGLFVWASYTHFLGTVITVILHQLLK